MHKTKVKVLPEAKRDLFNAVDYISNELCNEMAGLELLIEFEELKETLALFPRLGTYKEFPDLEEEYRFKTIGNYAVFYYIKDETVVIAFIRHESQKI